jgi:hypothetical protein
LKLNAVSICSNTKAVEKREIVLILPLNEEWHTPACLLKMAESWCHSISERLFIKKLTKELLTSQSLAAFILLLFESQLANVQTKNESLRKN